jgi:hypothetical protein
MSRVINDPYKFIEVPKDLTETDDEFVSGKLHIFGYRPTFLNTGTTILYVNNRPLKPGDQWHDNVPEQFPIEKDYDLVIGDDLSETSDINGLIVKQGAWLRVSYLLKVECY